MVYMKQLNVPTLSVIKRQVVHVRRRNLVVDAMAIELCLDGRSMATVTKMSLAMERVCVWEFV
jgi:hypothetical protein